MEQLTLGLLEIKVKALSDYQKNFRGDVDGDGKVYYDFRYYFPTEIHSWRGDYSHLALNIDQESVYNSLGKVIERQPLTIIQFYELLKKANGSDFEGYKGGIYTAHDETPIWVSNYGDSGRTAVVGVTRDYNDLIIQTSFMGYSF